MLLEVSKIKNMPVGAMDEGALIGKVEKVIIQPEEGKIIGFLVMVPGFLAQPKVVSFQDVVSIDAQGLVINSGNNLLDKDEIVRIGELIKTKFSLTGLPAKTKNKKYLGRVRDVVIEANSGDVIRIYVKNLWDEKIFERSMIYKISPTEVILTFDPRKKVKDAAPAPIVAKRTEVV